MVFPLFSSPIVCRICHSGEDSSLISAKGLPLVSLCECTGSVGLYHRACLEVWLAQSGTTQCELCKHEFKVLKHKKGFWEVWYSFCILLTPFVAPVFGRNFR